MENDREWERRTEEWVEHQDRSKKIKAQRQRAKNRAARHWAPKRVAAEERVILSPSSLWR